MYAAHNQATGYASKHCSVPLPSQDKLGGLQQKGHSMQKSWDDGGGGTDSHLDGMASGWIIVIFPCTIKTTRWQAVMEEVDKGCSEFCLTVGTVTRIASILIHSQILGVNTSQPSGRLWLYDGLIGSNNPHWLKADLVISANPSYSSSWV